MYIRNGLDALLQRTQGYATELLHTKLERGKHYTHIIGIYRPPNTNKRRFIKEIDDLLKSIPENDNVVLIGDTNINIMLHNNLTDKYKSTLCDHGLQCMISECTREEVTGDRLVTSCIDHACVRAPAQRLAAHILTCKLSDHYLIGVNISTGISCSASEVVQRKPVCVLNSRLINDMLDKVNWGDFISIKCPILLYNKLVSLFSDIYERAKTTIYCKQKRKTQPWMNNTIIKMIERRDELFRVWKSSPKSVTNRLNYTKFRNLTSKYIYMSKQKYKQNEIKNCENNSRKIWHTINSWLGAPKPTVDTTILKYLGKTDSLPNICTKFANTFTEEISLLKHNCNIKFMDRQAYIKQCNLSFRYQKVNNLHIEKIIGQLCKKTPGVDEIRVQELKHVQKEISPVLANFVNMCIQKGKYPDELKKSIIRPIYKQGSHCEYSNYRPIAILPVINKIMEKVIVNQISTFLEKHNVISDAQHGFRQSRSTSTALAKFSDEVCGNLNNKKYIGVLFIDFKKAFDTLDHEQLLQAMDECGVRGPVLEWFRTYLSKRTLRVSVGGVSGDEAEVHTGVPTGSVYGPLGYIMHVNSVANVVRNCSTYMYADDTCLLYADKDINNVQTYIQQDFENILKWSHDNGIILNTEKTKFLLIQSPHIKPSQEPIQIIGHTYGCLHIEKRDCKCKVIEVVDKFKYLGLTIDKHINWKIHVDTVCNRLRSILCKIISLKNIVNIKTLRMLYHALAEAVIGYGLIAYGRTFKTYLDKILNLQLRLLKNIIDKNTRANCSNDYTVLFKKLNILPVHDKVKYLIATEQFNNPEFKTPRVYTRAPRGLKRRKYVEPTASNYYGKRTRGYITPRIFNTFLIEDECGSKNIFKSKIKKLLIGTYTHD
jgi:hypothetical protein